MSAEMIARLTARQPIPARPRSEMAGPTAHHDDAAPTAPAPQDARAQLAHIARSGRTAFEKRVWTALCQVPRGRFTTYGALSAHVGSSPRAVGNALRRNPFAPRVPCHRVVAADRTLGGFKGVRPGPGPAGELEGITLREKRVLLAREGVGFDGRGRVVGAPFTAFCIV